MKVGLRAVEQGRWSEARKALLPVALRQTNDGPTVRAEAEYLSAVTLLKDGQRDNAHEALSEMYRDQTHPMRHDVAATLCDEFGGNLAAAPDYAAHDDGTQKPKEVAAAANKPAPDDGSEQMKAGMAAADKTCQDLRQCEDQCRASAKNYECVVLAGKYWEGDGVPKSPSKMPELNRAACAAGNKFACMLMSNFDSKAANCDDDTCSVFCDATFYSACVRLGDKYFKGVGVAKDASRGVALFKKACDANNTDGCNALGFAYGKGIGVQKDWATARTYLKKACDAGHQGACNAVPNVDCIVSAKAAQQRRPGDDAKCAAAKGQTANALIVDMKKTYVAYETPDVNKLDICFDALRSEGCYQINVLARNTSIYCCP